MDVRGLAEAIRNEDALAEAWLHPGPSLPMDLGISFGLKLDDPPGKSTKIAISIPVCLSEGIGFLLLKICKEQRSAEIQGQDVAIFFGSCGSGKTAVTLTCFVR